ncbi:MAG: transposase [Oscillospiraceae bacterium]
METELPRRKPNRLRDYDYSQPGAYFVTICTRGRENIFWRENVGADIIRLGTPAGDLLSRYGKIAECAILAISDHYTGVTVDQYVVMPNHLHILVRISETGGRLIAAPTLSTVIGQLKRHVAKQIGQPIWQRSFYDHIIRNEDDYRTIWEYIANNPAKWTEDRFYIP